MQRFLESRANGKQGRHFKRPIYNTSSGFVIPGKCQAICWQFQVRVLPENGVLGAVLCRFSTLWRRNLGNGALFLRMFAEALLLNFWKLPTLHTQEGKDKNVKKETIIVAFKSRNVAQKTFSMNAVFASLEERFKYIKRALRSDLLQIQCKLLCVTSEIIL